jgi:hypothetical protein
LVKITTALESLLIFNETEPLTNCIAERTAAILADDRDKYQKIREFMLLLYAYRSKIVHHGEIKFSKEELNQFQFTAGRVILAIINKRDEWQVRNQDDFIYWLEKRRLDYRFGRT